MLVEQAATMAAATDTAQDVPMEEEKPTSKIAEEEPPKKSEVAMTTTSEQAFVMPLEDKKSSLVVDEVPKIVKFAEKEVEAAKKGVAGGKYKDEDEELERKYSSYEGLEAKNGEAEGGRGGNEHMKVEEAKKDGKVGILGVVEAMKNDGSGEITKDIEIVGSMEEATLMLVMEKGKDNSALGDGTNFLASHDEVEGEDKIELFKEEQEKEESGVIVEAKVENDVDSIVVEEEKPGPKGQKGEDVGFGGGDGGSLVEEKVTMVSSVGIEAVELEDKVSPFPKANNALGYDKEATNDAMVVGGEEIPKQSVGNNTTIEYEATMSKKGDKTVIVAMNNGSIEEVSLANADSVLDDCPTNKDANVQVTTSEAADEVGVALEEEVVDKVSDDVESRMGEKEKQKQEVEKNEEVGSLGGDDGELNKGKDVEVLILSIEANEMEDKLAPLAKTSEKLGYVVQGSNNIVDVNEGSVVEVTPGSAYHVLEDISKEYNVEGQATASEAEDEARVVLEMYVPEKVENDERSLLDKDAKPKLECVKSEDIGSGGSDGGKLDEEKEAKVSIASMCVEPQAGAMVVNDRSIDEVDLACEDNMLVGSSKNKRNIEGQITELNKEVHVVLEPKVTYKVSDDTESDMVEDEKAELEAEKSEEIESVCGNDGKLDEGKDIDVFTISVEVIESEDKLGPLPKTNEKIGYVKEGSDDVVDVNEGSADEVTPASAYSVLEDFSKNEYNVESEANAMEVNDRIIGEVYLASKDNMLVDSPIKKQNNEVQTTANEVKEEVHVVGEQKVTDNVTDYTDSCMDGEEKAKAEGKKCEDIGFLSGNGGELGEGKDVEGFTVTIEDIELEQKLSHLGETNENFGYAEEGNDDLVDVNKGSVKVVIPESTYSLAEGISKKKHNVKGQATTSEGEEQVSVIVDMYVPDKMSDDAKTLVAKEEKPILEGMKSEEVGSGAWDVVEFDEEKEVELSIPSIVFVEPEADAMVVNNRSIEEVDLACEDNAFVSSLENKQSAKGHITKIEVKEEVHVIVEPEVIDKVPDDTEFDMEGEEKPEPEGEKSEDIVSIGGNVGELDEGKDIDVFSVSVEAIELKDKLGPLDETTEKFGYEKEGSGDIVDVSKENVDDVTLASVFSELEDIFKKEYNDEGQATASDAKEEVGVLVEMYVAEEMPDYAKSLLANEDMPKQEGEEGKEIGFQGRDGAKLDEAGEVEVSIVSIGFVELEAGAMMENDRSIEKVALASEDKVLVDCPKKKQSDESHITEIEVKEEVHVVVEPEVIDKVPDDTDSDMANDEKPGQQGEKSEEIGSIGGNGGELDEGKYIEANELKDKLGPLDETNEKIGYDKEGSDDIVDVNEGSVEEVTPASVFSALEDIFKEYNDEGQTTMSDAKEDICVIAEMYVEENGSDYAKSLLTIEERPTLEGTEAKKIGSQGRDGDELDEGEVKISVLGIAFVEPEAGAMMENDRSIEEVALANEDNVLVVCPKMKQRNESRITKIEVKEEHDVVVEPEVINKVPDDTDSYMANMKMPEPQGEKSEEIWSISGNGGDLDEAKDIEVFSVSIEAIELKDKLGPLARTTEKFGYEKEGSNDIVDVSEGSVEDVTPTSVCSALEDIFQKEYNAEGQTTMVDSKEDIGAIAEMYVAEKVPDYAKSLLTTEEMPTLEGTEGKKIGSQGRDGDELDEGEVKVSVVGIAFVEPEVGAMMKNDRSIEEIALANEDNVLVDCPEMKQSDESPITKIEVKEEQDVVVEPEVINKVSDDTDSYMADMKMPERQGEKSEEIWSIGGNGGELDEGKDIEVFSVSVEASELNDKLDHLAETNEKIGYEKEGSAGILDVHEESVEDVTPEFVYSVLKGDYKTEHNDESQETTSEREEQEEKPKQESVKREKVDSRVWDGVELGEENEAEISVASIVFIEQEACAMVVNDRDKEEVDLACEDIVLMGRAKKKQNTESDMTEEEKAETEGEKGEEIGSVDENGGELEEKKDVEVFTVSDEVIELEDNLAHLYGTNKDVGYVKEESYDIVVMDERSVERVTPESSYCVLEGISKKENSVEGQVTTSEVEETGVVVERYVAGYVPDDAKSLIAKEEKPKLEGVKAEEVGYVGRDGGELDENEGEVFVASIVFFEPDGKIASFSKANDDMGFEKKQSNDGVVAGKEEAPSESMDKDINVEEEDANLKSSREAVTMIVDEESGDEVAPSSAYHILENSPNKEQNVEGQANASEAGGEVCVAMEAKVMDKVPDDMEHVVVVEDNTILEGEKGKEVGSLGGDELDEEKEFEASAVIVNVGELEDKVASFAETSGKLDYTKKGSDGEVVVGDQRAHKESTSNNIVFEGEVAKSEPESETSTVAMYDRSAEEGEASAKRVLENNPWKEHNVEGQATTSETDEEVGVIVEAEVADDEKYVVAKEDELQLEVEKGGKVGYVDRDGGVLYDEKELEVSVIGTAPEDKVASFSKSNDELGFEKEVSNDIVVMGETPKESTKNDTYAEDDATKLEQLSETSIVCEYDGSVEEIVSACANNVLMYSSMKEQNNKGQEPSSEMEEEVGLLMKGKVIDKELNEMEFVDTEEKVELEGDKSKEVGSIGGDGDESDKEKKDKVFVVNIEAIQFEHKLASIDETNFKLGYEKKIRDDIVVAGDEEVPKESTKKEVDIEKETSNPQPSSEASTVVVNDGSLDELAPTSADSVLEGSPLKELNFEGQSTTSEAMEDVGVVKPSKVENIATAVQDLGVEKSIEDENIVGAVKGADVEKLIKAKKVNAANIDGTLPLELPPKSIKENNDAEEIKGGADVVHHEGEFDDDIIIEVVPGYEDGFGNEGNEDDDESIVDTIPTTIVIFESNEATKQVMKEHVEGSSTGSVSSLRDFTNSMDEQIMLQASKDDGDEKGVDSTIRATLLNSENGASSEENVRISSQDGSKILNMDRPAGLGSSALSLRPTTPNLLVSSELAAIIVDPIEEMTEEERKLHDKVELIRVKFLRLVYNLGITPNEMVVTQVLYRLGLAEGITHGRQTKQASGLDNAWKKALTLEGEGENDLNFSCNILVLGKTGVGKSATINSIFGKEKSKTDAFNSATTSVQEIVGDVHGVKIRIIDTPGLQSSVMDQGSNRKILAAVKKYTKKCPPDIVLYVDRLDCLSRDLNDLPLLKTITDVLGSSIWFNAIVALTHAASVPEELNGMHMTYEVLMAQTSHIIHQSIRQATGDMNLMNPIAFVENHSSCQRNHEDQKVLPNGQSWRHHMLLLCYSSKILSEANSLLKLANANHENLLGLNFHSLPLPFLMSSLLELRTHPKFSAKHGGNEGDSDTELDGYSDLHQDDEEKEYDHLPAFKLLTKAQLAMLTTKQKNAYFDEYDYKVKLPPSFDCDNPTYRYRFLEPTSIVTARPVLDAHGWDHDYGYDGVSVEETLAILEMFPANVAVQVTKNKKEFGIHLDSSIAAKHGENASSLAHFDIQTIGHQLAYILRGETQIKNTKKNKTIGGFLVTFLGDIVATGLKVEDHISLGKSMSLVASTGMTQAQGDTAYGANLEARLKGKTNPIGQSLSTLGLSLMKWHQELALGANLQSQFSIGRGSKMGLRLGLNNKLSGQIGVKTRTSEQVQIALLGLVPIAASIYRSLQPSEPSFA